MIAYIDGKVIYKKANYVIVLAGSVGYKVFVIPTEHFSLDEETALFLHEHISEEKDDLYGFKSAEQLEIFQMLISVSGLGPKIAMTILSSLNKDNIESAIEAGNIKAFEKIKGIGKKLAAKIILELKGKIDLLALEDKSNIAVADIEAEEALISLGFKKVEIDKILSNLPKDIITIEIGRAHV